MSESLTASEVEHLRTLLQRLTEYDLDQAYVNGRTRTWSASSKRSRLSDLP